MIALASDHAGFSYKEKIKTVLNELQLPFTDFGTDSNESVDYPDYGHAAALAVSKGECNKGILVCGTGIGMSIVANKHTGVRAAACETIEAAELSRKHNDANVLCIGERLTTWDEAQAIVRIFLTTDFEGGRHERRVEKIHSLTSC
jgi:ribose 5-phosphate isomerase B